MGNFINYVNLIVKPSLFELHILLANEMDPSYCFNNFCPVATTVGQFLQHIGKFMDCHLGLQLAIL